MKKTYLITLSITIAGLLLSCSESFLEKNAVGAFSESTLSTAEGVRKALNGAYSQLNGGGIGMWTTSPFADVSGSIQGGEYTKGSSAFDFLMINESVAHDHTTGSGLASGIFSRAYTGIDRCNITLSLAAAAEGLSETQRSGYIAEARFLRAIYYFQLKRDFYNIPWIDETATDARIPNYEGEPSAQDYVDIWPEIIADFRFAMENLPATQSDLARPNKWAAQCFLAKALLYAGTYDPSTYASGLTEALTLLNGAISSGVTSNGDAYALIDNYHDNFDAAYEHNAEYVWGIELSTLDGDADGFFASPNANGGAQFWGMWRDPNGPDKAMGWGFQQPTEWWANHFRTDARGLPYLDMFEGASSSSDTLADDYALDPAPAAFEVDTQGVDPRLDWSIGRRGVDYLGWGEMAGSSWIRAQLESSPYENKKHHVWKDQVGVYQSTSNCYPAINQALMRFSDVLLMAAELEVRTGGSLDRARTLVNQVRERMTLNTASERHYVKKYDAGGSVIGDAANYRIGLYDVANADDPFATADGALDAILYERTLELGGEGVRFYDVVRFGKGLEEFNNYLNFEKSLTNPVGGGPRYGHYTANYSYEEPKDMFLPIPTTAIDRSKLNGVPTLIQNPGY